jgi:hypothetical protein
LSTLSLRVVVVVAATRLVAAEQADSAQAQGCLSQQEPTTQLRLVQAVAQPSTVTTPYLARLPQPAAVKDHHLFLVPLAQVVLVGAAQVCKRQMLITLLALRETLRP